MDIPVTYEITAAVEPALRDAFESYMISRHIPDLFSTGVFSSASFSRSVLGRYRIRYEAVSRSALDNYLERDAARLRKHFQETFPEGIDVTREEWDVIRTFAVSQDS